MGLLKLGSIYKKKNKKTSEVLAPPLPSKIEPISLELNLNLDQSSSINTNSISNPKLTQRSDNDNKNAAPAGSGSLFEDIFAELGSKTAVQTNESGKAGQPSVFDNDFSLALALSQQLDLEQDSTNPMTGTAQSGNNTFNNNNNKSSNQNNASSAPASNANANSNFLFGGDSIYSNYLKGLSALDNKDSSLSSSMFDSILNKNTTSTTTTSSPSSGEKAAVVTPTVASPSYITQVVLDSDISDSDEESKNSEDSDEEYDLSNIHGKTQRRTKGVKPIMERRTQDNRLLVQRKIDNWSNRVDPESNRVESNESMIERMKDRHRNQVKMAALRNQQQQLDDFNMMGYPQQQPQHMVPQPYGAPTMMPLHTANGAVLQHPGLLMDPVQMYYPNTQLQPAINDTPDVSMSPSNIPQPPPPIPAAFLPNPTHHTLAAPYPSKDEDEHLPEEQINTHQNYSSISPDSSIGNSNTVMMNHSNNNSRTNSSTVNYSKTKVSSTPSSASSTTSSKNPSSLAVNLEEDSVYNDNLEEESPETNPIVDSPPELQDIVEAAAEEADCEISGDEENDSGRTVTTPRRKKSVKKPRQQSKNDVPVTNESAVVPRAIDSGYTSSPQVVRSSRSTPNLKKGKKKSNPSSRSSSRRNSRDYTSSPPSESMVATPPPLPNSPYLHYNQNSDENLYRSHGHAAIPRSSSQHQLHYQQQQNYHNQENRHSLRHMKSEPELPRRSNSNHSTSNLAYQQQKFYQQQQQLNLEWERMQNFQREQLLKQNVQSLSQQQVPFMPMYTPMYYPSATSTPPVMVGGMMMDPAQMSLQHQHQHQKYETYQNHVHPINASTSYNNNYQHQLQHKSSYHNNYNSPTR